VIKLHIKKTDSEIKEISLEAGVFQIGRSSDNDVVIADSTISRVHAEITITDESVTLKNIQTSSDLLVNGDICTDEVLLADNDTIMLGLVKVQLEAPYLNEVNISDDDSTRLFSGDELAAAME
jgi:pSer/pThr/pTyr-binding forkhead associated (FHA) protein